MLEMEYQDLEDKITMICLNKKMQVTFSKKRFPIFVTVNALPQEDVIPGMEEFQEVRSKGKLQFIFGEKLKLSIDDGFDISDDLLSKIKNNLKKWHYTYLQYIYMIAKEREDE